jgi:hypothetical protein
MPLLIFLGLFFPGLFHPKRTTNLEQTIRTVLIALPLIHPTSSAYKASIPRRGFLCCSIIAYVVNRCNRCPNRVTLTLLTPKAQHMSPTTGHSGSGLWCNCRHLTNFMVPSRRKRTPLQRGEGARGLSGWLSSGAKAKLPYGWGGQKSLPKVLSA